MSYDAFEISTESSQPVELYKFVLNGTTFAYTSSEDAVTVGSVLYAPIAISRGKVDQTRETRANIVEVTVSSSNPIAQAYIATIPGQRTSVTILRYQRPDGATPQVVTVFSGFVSAVAFENFGMVAKISILPATAALSRPVPRVCYQSQCNHVLYDARCTIDENLFRYTTIVSAVSGSTITLPGAGALGANYFDAGRVDFPSTGDRRLVLSSSGDVLTLLLPFAQNPLGAPVNAFAGCAHDGPTCAVKFANTVNYGGFPFVPHENPFQTGL